LAEDEDEATEIDLSLCGYIITSPAITGGDMILKAFDEHRISFEAFCKAPKELLKDPRLVVRIEDNYYNW